MKLKKTTECMGKWRNKNKNKKNENEAKRKSKQESLISEISEELKQLMDAHGQYMESCQKEKQNSNKNRQEPNFLRQPSSIDSMDPLLC